MQTPLPLMNEIPTLLAAMVRIEGSSLPWPAQTVWQAALYTIGFGIIGIFLTAFGFKVFDWITPGIRVESELAEKHNIAVAIVVAAIILGISGVIAVSMIG